MGFFISDAEAEIIRTRAKTTKAEPAAIRRQSIVQSAKGCDACPLKSSWGTLSSPRMKIKGPKDARILVLGGAPSKDADFEGEPFSKAERQILEQCIPARDREIVAYGHMARCSTDAPDYKMMHSCSVHLEDDLEKRPIKYVIGLGQGPLNYFWPGRQISRVNSVKIPIKIGNRLAWYMPVLGIETFMDTKEGGRKLFSAWGASFKADIKRVFSERKTWGSPVVHVPKAEDVIIVEDEKTAEMCVAEMQGNLGIDFEASKLKPYERESRLISAAISDGDITIAFAVDHPEKQHAWALPFIVKTMRQRQWVAHNASMELVWAINKGKLSPHEKVLHDFDDSQGIIRLLTARESVGRLEESTMIAFGCNIKEITGVNAKRIMDYTLAEVLPYNGLDAYGSAMIDRIMGDEARRDPNYARIIGSVESTAIMELQGLPIDLVAAGKLNTQWDDAAKIAEASAKKTYEARQFEQKYMRPFRVSANEDVGKALVEFGRLNLPKLAKEGTYKTDDEALTAATKDNPHPLATATLAYRTATKMKTTYVSPFVGDEGKEILSAAKRYEDDLLHPSYTVMLTKTARLSSADPNIQNFPKRKHRELRRSIIPPKGYKLVAIDYAQLEWRLAAMASRCKYLCETILSGQDAHAYWRDFILDYYPDYWYRMADMTGADPNDEKATLKGGRTIIKTDFTFATVFGSSVKSCSERTGIPLPKMEYIQGEFWNRAQGVKAWHKKQRQEYDTFATIRTLTGRIRRGVSSGNEPINTPIQGTGADIVTESMNAMHALAWEYKEPCLMPRINIHDDITFFLPDTHENEFSEYLYIIAETLTKVRHPWQIVPLGVEVSVGDNWADIKEIMVHTGDYVK